jgi:hypothetical protein
MRLLLLICSIALLSCGDTNKAHEDTDTDTDADCTAFDMALQQAETVAPSVIRISFKLTCDGDPMPGKTEEDFTISEDGDSISVFESAQQIVPTVASFQLSSVLVLDMSGSMIESGNLPGLQIAADSFISTMGGRHSRGLLDEPWVPSAGSVEKPRYRELFERNDCSGIHSCGATHRQNARCFREERATTSLVLSQSRKLKINQTTKTCI